MVADVRYNMLTGYDHTSHSAERREVSTGGKNTVLPGRRGSLSLGCYWTAILRREGRKVKSGTALWLRIHMVKATFDCDEC